MSTLLKVNNSVRFVVKILREQNIYKIIAFYSELQDYRIFPYFSFLVSSVVVF